jgi:hypothetical protein
MLKLFIGDAEPASASQGSFCVSATRYRGAKYVSVIAIIVPPFELGDVQRKIFAADFVEAAHDAANDPTSGPLSGQTKVVEADESYIGGKAKNKAYGPPPKKMTVFSLVEREGKVRSRHVADVTAKTLRNAIVTQVDRKSYLMTDEAPVYTKTGEEFSGHGTVNHSANEYVRHGGFMHTNTIESFFAIMKRGVYGNFHSVSEVHLHRYLSEFDFKYNHRSALGYDDAERADALLRGAKGKRLFYQWPDEAPHA